MTDQIFYRYRLKILSQQYNIYAIYYTVFRKARVDHTIENVGKIIYGVENSCCCGLRGEKELICPTTVHSRQSTHDDADEKVITGIDEEGTEAE